MDAEIERYVALKREKAEAKQRSLAAIGEAKLAELEGRKKDAEEAWAAVAEYGYSTGTEGKCQVEMQKIADAYVAAHPGDYAFFERFIRLDGTPKEQEQAQDALVGLINTFRRAGDVESQAKAELFELARFPRKNIGSQSAINYRGVRAGG